MKEIMTSVEDAVKTIAMILLVVAGGGVLKQILIDSGLGTYIGSLIHGSDMSPLLMAWLIAAVIRTSVGSATVAALTAGGIVAPLIPLTGVSPELMVLAVGAGSVIFSPPNDPGFWLFKEFFGLTIKGTIRTWCALETIISVAGMMEDIMWFPLIKKQGRFWRSNVSSLKIFLNFLMPIFFLVCWGHGVIVAFPFGAVWRKMVWCRLSFLMS